MTEVQYQAVPAVSGLLSNDIVLPNGAEYAVLPSPALYWRQARGASSRYACSLRLCPSSLHDYEQTWVILYRYDLVIPCNELFNGGSASLGIEAPTFMDVSRQELFNIKDLDSISKNLLLA